MKNFLYCFILIIVHGCVSNQRVNIIENNSIEKANTPSVYFFADNQFHLPDGKSYPLQNYVADKFSGVAVRPPQTTVFGPLAFETFLSGIDQSPLLIHLGDAADISCPQELDRFFRAMDSYAGPWIFLPGNHDGFYTGNSQHKSEYTKTWDNACGGERLDKADTIISYLTNRFGESYPRLKDGETEVKGDWSKNGYNGSYFANIVHDRDSTQKSFIVQQVSFKSKGGHMVRIVIIDTSQYEKPPKYGNLLKFAGHKVAGITGEILDDQIAVIEQWLSEKTNPDETLYIAGHHPLKTNWYTTSGLAWMTGSKWLKKNIYDADAAGYISAHTHKGWKRNLGNGKYEWNVSSFVDWPLGMIAMSMNTGEPKITEILYDREKTVPGVSGYCSDNIEWKSSKDDFYYYTRYRDEKFTGGTGRYMHHYLLIAELELIIDTFKEFDTDGKYKEFISNKEQVVEKVKSRLSGLQNRINVDSGDEIEYLRPHVTEAVDVLNKFHKTATGQQKKLIDKFSWCQLWWAAKQDAQRQWGVKDVTGIR